MNFLHVSISGSFFLSFIFNLFFRNAASSPHPLMSHPDHPRRRARRRAADSGKLHLPVSTCTYCAISQPRG
jgi:hypothetical protein